MEDATGLCTKSNEVIENGPFCLELDGPMPISSGCDNREELVGGRHEVKSRQESFALP